MHKWIGLHIQAPCHLLFWFPSEKLQIKKENSKTHVTSHISLARASHMSISDFSGAKKCSLSQRGVENINA